MTNNHNIVFRTDASAIIGIGHVMRCLALANELKKFGARIYFLSRNLPDYISKLIVSEGHYVNMLASKQECHFDNIAENTYQEWLGVEMMQDVNEVCFYLSKIKPDWLLVDHYALDSEWHNRIKPYTKKIMVIDDLANRKLSCDILLDQTYQRNKYDYKNYLEKNCQLFLGTEYALLKPEFHNLRQSAISKREKYQGIRRLLISVGSMDPDNYTCRILKGLVQVKWPYKPEVDVVLSSVSPSYPEIMDTSLNCGLTINVHTDTTSMQELMLQSDLAIGSGGTSSWERCCLGLPSIVIQIAENQRLVIANLAKSKAVIRLQGNDISNEVRDCMHEILSNKINLKLISDRAFKVCNGLGAKLIAIKLCPKYASDTHPVSLRMARVSDIELMYELQSDPRTRAYSHNNFAPSYAHHKKWVLNKLDDINCNFYIIEHNNQVAGVVRLDFKYEKNNFDGYYLLSIYISPEHYQKSIAAIALEYINNIYSTFDIHAEVLPENIASIKTFMKSGYKKVENKDLFIRYANIHH